MDTLILISELDLARRIASDHLSCGNRQQFELAQALVEQLDVQLAERFHQEVPF
jgi:ABC-type ATPase involved in cell division